MGNEENILFVDENEDESEHEETIDIHMKMISHQRKASESEISFISAFDGGHDIDENEFASNDYKNDERTQRRQLSKSRDEFMIKSGGYHKKKTKEKIQTQQTQKN